LIVLTSPVGESILINHSCIILESILHTFCMTSKHCAVVAVLRGGWSLERDVSLKSGLAVLKALNAKGYVTKDIIVEKNIHALIEALTPPPSIVFNALHGVGGEDGVIQGVLEMMGIPYTHSGVLASALAMDKDRTKQIVMHHGILCPKGVVVAAGILLQSIPLPLPIVIKPVNEGSSIGVHLAHDIKTVHETARQYQDDFPLLIEEFIEGRELTCPVLGTKALPVIEIVPQEGFYDYEAKYSIAKHAAFAIPAPIPQEITTQVQECALKAHTLLGCKGVSRSDFRYNPTTQKLYFLEINSQPGMTDLSLVPASASSMGLSFIEVIEHLLGC
jgi:D-alanine-D-alanine ligase